jgi:hypothetical protein
LNNLKNQASKDKNVKISDSKELRLSWRRNIKNQVWKKTTVNSFDNDHSTIIEK